MTADGVGVPASGEAFRQSAVILLQFPVFVSRAVELLLQSELISLQDLDSTLLVLAFLREGTCQPIEKRYKFSVVLLRRVTRRLQRTDV